MRLKLTRNQQKVFDFLKQKVKENGISPSLRTAAAELSISHTAVAQTLKVLEDKGYIRRERRYSRIIHILDNTGELYIAQRQQHDPGMSTVAAGRQIEAEQKG